MTLAELAESQIEEYLQEPGRNIVEHHIFELLTEEPQPLAQERDHLSGKGMVVRKKELEVVLGHSVHYTRRQALSITLSGLPVDLFCKAEQFAGSPNEEDRFLTLHGGPQYLHNALFQQVAPIPRLILKEHEIIFLEVQLGCATDKLLLQLREVFKEILVLQMPMIGHRDYSPVDSP